MNAVNVPDYLEDVMGDVEPDTSGEPAGCIPELATADPDRLGAAFAMVDGAVYGGLSAFAGRQLHIDEAVCASEMDNAHRNLGIAYMLRSHGILTEDPRDVVDGYIRQCSVLVTTRDLAMMAATLANRGVNPLSRQQVVDERVVRQILSVMATCGMLDAAGDWATQIGIPAKSGVAGGLIGALPGQLGGSSGPLNRSTRQITGGGPLRTCSRVDQRTRR